MLWQRTMDVIDVHVVSFQTAKAILTRLFLTSSAVMCPPVRFLVERTRVVRSRPWIASATASSVL